MPNPRPSCEDRIRAALWFAERGFGVFSVWSTDPDGTCRCGKVACDQPGKHPVPGIGFKAATTDPVKIRAMLSAGSDPNWGMLPPEGVFALDVDGDGIAHLAELEAQHGALPPTLRTNTAHGQHIFLRWPEGHPRPIGQLFGYVTRWGSGASAGYVIGPRSVHATGAVYTPGDASLEIAELPEAWAAACVAPRVAAAPDVIEITGGYELPPPGYDGSRYEAILRFAGSRYMRGISKEEVLAGVLHVLAPRFAQPLGEPEIRSRFERAWKGTPERLGAPLVAEAPRPAKPQRAIRAGMDAADLLALDLPPLRWVVPELLPEGTTILAAPPKIGKSCLIYQIAVEVAIGGELLGRRVKPGAVLYLALEDGQRRGQDRLKVALDGRTMPMGRLEVRWDARNIGEGLEADIEAWLDAHPDAAMVALDTLGKVRPNSDGRRNAYEVDVQALTGLQDLFRDRQVALVIVHHARKEATDDFLASVSGTYGLTGSADTVIAIRRKRLEAFGTLMVTGRDIADAELPVEFVDGTWRPAPAALPEASFDRVEVYRVIEEAGPIYPQAIADRIGKSRNNVQNMVTALVRSGAVARTGHGYVVAGVTIQPEPSRAPAYTGNPNDSSYSESNGSHRGHTHAREAPCPECGRSTAVTDAGAFAAHYRADDLGDAKWGRQPCPGSGTQTSSGWLNPCRQYPDHQNDHRQTPSGWTCVACYPEERP